MNSELQVTNCILPIKRRAGVALGNCSLQVTSEHMGCQFKKKKYSPVVV